MSTGRRQEVPSERIRKRNWHVCGAEETPDLGAPPPFSGAAPGKASGLGCVGREECQPVPFEITSRSVDEMPEPRSSRGSGRGPVAVHPTFPQRPTGLRHELTAFARLLFSRPIRSVVRRNAMYKSIRFCTVEIKRKPDAVKFN